MYPHHPSKPYIESIEVGENSGDITVTFSTEVFTTRASDGSASGDLILADFDVVFYGGQRGSVTDISKTNNSEYVLTIGGINPANVLSYDRVEVRLAECVEDLGYKSLKTVYSRFASNRQGAYALQGAIANLRGTLRHVAQFDPNPATEGTDNAIAVSIGRDGNTIGTVTYTNITLSSICLLYTSPSPRDRQKSRMPSSA